MTKSYTIIFWLIFSLSAFGQNLYFINGFSDKYFGKLKIDAGYEQEVFKKGVISILNKSDSIEIIRIESDNLTFDLDEEGNLKTNVQELPYGEQSIIISEDFNFDGLKDLAIMDGQNSCYNGPSFQIYLQKNELVHSPEFTRLAQEYCGMFQVNYETKTLSTMTKSGCCWHQFSEFAVVDDIPKLTLKIEEDAMDFPYITVTTIDWKNNEKKEIIEKTIDLEQDGIVEIISFELVKSKKRVILFNINDRTLNYALIKRDSLVEFNYPIETISNNHDFKIDNKETKLIFNNGNTAYQIYENRKENKISSIGVLVTLNGKEYDLKGDLTTLKGTLRNIKIIKLDNVIVE